MGANQAVQKAPSDRDAIFPPLLNASIIPRGICNLVEYKTQRSWCGDGLSLLDQWRYGVADGGNCLIPNGRQELVQDATKIVRDIYSLDLLREVLGLSKEEKRVLREVGIRMLQHGVAKQGNVDLIVKEGLTLSNGERIQPANRVLENVARLIVLTELRALHWSSVMPANLKNIEAINAATQRESQEVNLTALEKTRAFGVALAVAKLPQEILFHNLAPSMPSFNLIFHKDFVDHWIRLQLSKGWIWSRISDPADTQTITSIKLDDLNDLWAIEKTHGADHPDVERFISTSRFEDMPAKNQIFVSRLGVEVLDYLRRHSQEELRLMRSLGKKIIEVGTNLKPGGFSAPLAGVPLKDGSLAALPRELALGLAYDHHSAWLNVRAWQKSALKRFDLRSKMSAGV